MTPTTIARHYVRVALDESFRYCRCGWRGARTAPHPPIDPRSRDERYEPSLAERLRIHKLNAVAGYGVSRVDVADLRDRLAPSRTSLRLEAYTA